MGSMKDDVRKALQAKPIFRHAAGVQAPLTEREKKAIVTLTECGAFCKLNKPDHHDIRYFLDSLTNLTITESVSLSKKVAEMCTKGGDRKQALTEAVASSTADEIDGAEELGAYGDGDNKPKAPKGDADKGSDQKDNSRGETPKADGYLSEEDKEDDEEKDKEDKKEDDFDWGDEDEMKEDHYPGDGDEGGAGKKPVDAKDADDDEEKPEEDDDEEVEESDDSEVPEEAPTPGGEPSAKDATYKDGASQNEGKLKEDGGDKQSPPKDPGLPSSGTSGEKPEPEDMDLVKDSPDYSDVKEEDPSKAAMNVGPAKATVESFTDIEATVVRVLDESGVEVGSELWNKLYRKGFELAIAERAKVIGSKLLEGKKASS